MKDGVLEHALTTPSTALSAQHQCALTGHIDSAGLVWFCNTVTLNYLLAHKCQSLFLK